MAGCGLQISSLTSFRSPSGARRLNCAAAGRRSKFSCIRRFSVSSGSAVDGRPEEPPRPALRDEAKANRGGHTGLRYESESRNAFIERENHNSVTVLVGDDQASTIRRLNEVTRLTSQCRFNKLQLNRAVGFVERKHGDAIQTPVGGNDALARFRDPDLARLIVALEIRRQCRGDLNLLKNIPVPAQYDHCTVKLVQHENTTPVGVKRNVARTSTRSRLDADFR